MHTELKHSHIIFGIIAVIAFFGYLAYKDWFFDASASTQQTVNRQLQNLPKDTAGTPVVSPEYYGLRRAEIALAEYRKGVVEQPKGCNCGPRIDVYTEGTPSQWCTMFASWVGKEAGSGVVNEKTQSWKIVNSRDFARYLEMHGTWYSRQQVIDQQIKPRPGDYIVYWRGNFEDNLGHVDVVITPSDTPGKASTVGGNISDRVDYRENFSYLDNYGFLGLGRPEKG